MQKVTRYQTSDGVLHDTYEKAKRHANNRYGNHLLKIAKELVQIDKYEAMTVYLEKMDFAAFSELLKLKDDTKLLKPVDDGIDDDDIEV